MLFSTNASIPSKLAQTKTSFSVSGSQLLLLNGNLAAVAGMSKRQRPVPSKLYSNSELKDGHKELLKVKTEEEEDLEGKIQEPTPVFVGSCCDMS